MGDVLRKNVIGIVALGVLVVFGVGGYKYYAKSIAPKIEAGNNQALITPVATINGVAITDLEVRDLVSKGMERASAIDQRITQTVMANAASLEFPKTAEVVLNAAKTDILAQLYVNQKSELLRSKVTDKEIADFYAKNMTAEEFRKYRLKFVIAKDAKDGQDIYEAITKNPDSAESKNELERFQFLNKSGDNYQAAQEIPYGIGSVVKKMKAGELVQPLLVREGILIVKIDDIKEGVRPELAKVTPDIRASLASQKMIEEVQKLRKASKIELKS